MAALIVLVEQGQLWECSTSLKDVKRYGAVKLHPCNITLNITFGKGSGNVRLPSQMLLFFPADTDQHLLNHTLGESSHLIAHLGAD